VGPARASDLRERNLATVLGAVARSPGPVSRAGVAALTGLTRATVSTLVDALLDAALVAEVAPAPPARAGRPAAGLVVAGHRVAALGAEVGVDYLAGCVRDLTGAVRARHVVVGDNRGLGPADVLAASAALALGLLDRTAALGLEVAGAAWAVPGLVQAGGAVRLAPNLGWRDVDARGLLSREPRLAPLVVAVDNEATLGALADLWRPGGTGASPEGRGRGFLRVSGEIGVGAGVVLGGRLLRGQHGWSGELGHVSVDPAGPPCACGSRGCLEVYAGQEALLRGAALPDRPATRLGEGSAVTTLAAAAEAGEAAALGALARAGTALGVAAAAAVNLLDVDEVLLGGIYAPLAPWLLAQVEDEVQRRVLRARLEPVAVRVSATGPDAAVLGAAASILQGVMASPARWVPPPVPRRPSTASG
jgi:predicted NBD/HSP70 family sugar kinase